ncbi:hypothetical protein [Microscilla marina]|uniref:DUF4247 domain-containing protein n=1 Tax=Microscilla marina ATCC 23134 TaxID=313606 RepID=A1ZGW3_MICM2|nr:hypothetical protein [Microscilla marina]EAY30232.1 hypothetical protein M23134_08054 [Microscilla marina ATCC 23134]
MKNYTKLLVGGISFTIVFVTYLAVAQGWGVKPVRNQAIVNKYQGKSGYYGRKNKVLWDSVLAVRKRVRDSLRQRRRDSISKVGIRFNKTRDSVTRIYGKKFLEVYAGGRYLYAYGKRPRNNSSSDYSSSYSSSSSSGSVGSFRGGSSRSFRGGSRRGGK